jgi:hypothetical protein
MGSLASVVAVAIGFYAIVNPGAVSDYLDTIAENSRSSARSLASIDGSSGETAGNTGRIADEIPYWIETALIEPLDTVYAIQLQNHSNSAFDDIQIKLVDGRGRTMWVSDTFAIPPREGVKVRAEDFGRLESAAVYCVSGFSRAAERRFYERRELYPPKTYRVGLLFKSWQLADEPTSDCG